ncbi:MAG: bromoperoxidase, partial [Verrucomicrobiota bacterium]
MNKIMNTLTRKERALSVRQEAAKLASKRPHPSHETNGDEVKYRYDAYKDFKYSYLMSFTKGLKHDFNSGLVEEAEDFEQFVDAIDSGDPVDFTNTPLGPSRSTGGPGTLAWESDRGQGKIPARSTAVDANITSPEPVKVRAWESQSAGLAFDLEGPDSQAVTMPPAPALGSDLLTLEMAEVYTCALLRDTSF